MDHRPLLQARSIHKDPRARPQGPFPCSRRNPKCIDSLRPPSNPSNQNCRRAARYARLRISPGSNIRTLHLWFKESAAASRWVPETLRLLQDQSLNLEDFILEARPYGPLLSAEICQLLGGFIAAQPGIRRLDVKGLLHAFQDPFVSASGLAHLKQYIASYPYSQDTHPKQIHTSLDCQGFSILVQFQGSMAVDMMQPVLASISSQVLEDVHLEGIHLLGDSSNLEGTFEDVDDEYLGGVISALGSFKQLTKLFLSWVEEELDWNEIDPLVEHRPLQSLHLEGPRTTFLDDGILDMMTQSWPELRELHALGRGNWVQPEPATTLLGLECLARNCAKAHHPPDHRQRAGNVYHFTPCYRRHRNQRPICRSSRLLPR